MYMLSSLSLDYVIYLFERFMKIIDAGPEREREGEIETERQTHRQTEREIEREKDRER